MRKCYKCVYYKEIDGEDGKIYKCKKWYYQRTIGAIRRFFGCEYYFKYRA